MAPVSRRSFLAGLIAMPVVAALMPIKAQPDWTGPATYGPWQRRVDLNTQTGSDAYEKLRAAMRDIHAQCRDYQRTTYDMDRIQHAVSCELGLS